MSAEIVAYRFRPPESHHGTREWHYDTPEGLPKEDRETLRGEGWTVEPLVVPDDHRQRALDL